MVITGRKRTRTVSFFVFHLNLSILKQTGQLCLFFLAIKGVGSRYVSMIGLASI